MSNPSAYRRRFTWERTHFLSGTYISSQEVQVYPHTDPVAKPVTAGENIALGTKLSIGAYLHIVQSTSSNQINVVAKTSLGTVNIYPGVSDAGGIMR